MPGSSQGFRDSCLFFMGQQDQVQRDGMKLDPRVSTWMESSIRGQNCLCSCRKGLFEITVPPMYRICCHTATASPSATYLLHREAVELQPLEVLKECVDMDFRPFLVVVLQGLLDLMILEVFSNFNNLVISILYSPWRRRTIHPSVMENNS